MNDGDDWQCSPLVIQKMGRIMYGTKQTGDSLVLRRTVHAQIIALWKNYQSRHLEFRGRRSDLGTARKSRVTYERYIIGKMVGTKVNCLRRWNERL